MPVKWAWHGWTTRGNAQACEDLLKTYVFPSIVAKRVAGYRSIELFRRPLVDEEEFVTVMTFDVLGSVKALLVKTIELVYAPGRARAILKRFDDRSQHDEMIETRTY